MGLISKALRKSESRRWVKGDMYRKDESIDPTKEPASFCLAGLVYDGFGFTPAQAMSSSQKDKLRDASGDLPTVADGEFVKVVGADEKLCTLGMKIVAEVVDEKFPWVRQGFNSDSVFLFNIREETGDLEVSSQAFIIHFNDHEDTSEEDVRMVLAEAMTRAKAAGL